jgi:hypothetical protein
MAHARLPFRISVAAAKLSAGLSTMTRRGRKIESGPSWTDQPPDICRPHPGIVQIRNSKIQEAIMTLANPPACSWRSAEWTKMRHHLMLAATVGIAFSAPAGAQNIGPSTTTEPYMLPTISGVSTTSILTTGDSVGGYRMVGIPDGMGAWKDDDDHGHRHGKHHGWNRRTFNLVNNHELGKDAGVVRAHGSTGSFVARWLVDSRTLKVLSGRDHMTAPNDLSTWNGTAYVQGTDAIDRLCSADLAAEDAYRLYRSGTSARILLSGEETSPPFAADHGRVFAHVVSGPGKNKSYELPRLGKMSFENAVASPYRQSKTIVMLNDDAGRDTNVTVANVCRAEGQANCVSPPSELYMYVGTKQSTGNDVERAGLTNGNLYGVQVKLNGAVVTGEDKDFVFSSVAPAVTSARFELVNLGNVSGKTGVEIQDDSITNQVTQFIRIEDGAWDPREGKQRDYYFITTGRLSTSASSWRPSRLWRLRFDDITKPQMGGKIEMVLTNQFYAGAGTTPDDDPNFQMLDNIAIDKLGRIVMQEDVGGDNRRGRIYVYGIDSGELVQVAAHNAKFFEPGSPDFITNDEESSAVIDAAHILGDGWFLLTVQNHADSTDPELVEGGQFVAMYINPSIGRRHHHHHGGHGHGRH